MGRPINKKYFANLIAPYQNQATGGLTGQAGEGVASISTGTLGSIIIVNAGPTFPTPTIAAPELAGGTTATTAVVWEVDTVTITTGTGYTTGTITSITGLDGYANIATRFSVTESGGVPSFNVFTNRGEYTSIDGTGISTWNFVGPTGTDGQAEIAFRIKSISVVTTGSGYLSAPAVSWPGGNVGTLPSGQTTTLTSNVTNAIAVTAFVKESGSALPGDIMKQESSKRYLVSTTDGVGQCKLVTTSTLAVGEMTITATDSDNNTYFVKKLTAHKAVLVQDSGGTWQFADNTAAGWNLNTAVENVSVKISSN